MSDRFIDNFGLLLASGCVRVSRERDVNFGFQFNSSISIFKNGHCLSSTCKRLPCYEAGRFAPPPSISDSYLVIRSVLRNFAPRFRRA